VGAGPPLCRPFGTAGSTTRVRRLKPPAAHYAPFGSKTAVRPAVAMPLAMGYAGTRPWIV